jgi:hypothetical protein
MKRPKYPKLGELYREKGMPDPVYVVSIDRVRKDFDLNHQKGWKAG